MKFLKVSILAMALGFFAVSCSNPSTTVDTDGTEQVDDQTTDAPADENAAPAPETTDSTANQEADTTAQPAN